jgi:hypothetical protein
MKYFKNNYNHEIGINIEWYVLYSIGNIWLGTITFDKKAGLYSVRGISFSSLDDAKDYLMFILNEYGYSLIPKQLEALL